MQAYISSYSHISSPNLCSRTCLGSTYFKGTQNQYLSSEVLAIRVGLCTSGEHRDRMRSTYYPGVCTKPGTYYQGWRKHCGWLGNDHTTILTKSQNSLSVRACLTIIWPATTVPRPPRRVRGTVVAGQTSLTTITNGRILWP